MRAKFYICRHCGNMVGMIKEDGVPMMCCGEKMELLVPNTVEASGEKHLPVVTVEDGAVHVNVGAINHPMTPAHFIEWIYLETEKGGQRRILQPLHQQEPEAIFSVIDDKPIAVYAYCNLHGLWMTKI